MVGDEEQPIQLIWRSCTHSAFGSVYLGDSVTIMKLCKLDLTKYNMVDQS